MKRCGVSAPLSFILCVVLFKFVVAWVVGVVVDSVAGLVVGFLAGLVPAVVVGFLTGFVPAVAAVFGVDPRKSRVPVRLRP